MVKRKNFGGEKASERDSESYDGGLSQVTGRPMPDDHSSEHNKHTVVLTVWMCRLFLWSVHT